MSDLANSCEYLTIEKSCSAVSESEKAKANRQLRCQNDEKNACCYICLSRRECTISCKYLGQFEGESSTIEATEKTEAETTSNNDKKTEEYQTQNAPVACCSLCNVEMSQTKTKFRIDGWKGPHPKLSGDDLRELGEELPVIVYVCPQCGRLEFRADKKQ